MHPPQILHPRGRVQNLRVMGGRVQDLHHYPQDLHPLNPQMNPKRTPLWGPPAEIRRANRNADPDRRHRISQ